MAPDYSQVLARAANSVAFAALSFEEAMRLRLGWTAVDTRADLPPDLEEELTRCLKSGPVPTITTPQP